MAPEPMYFLLKFEWITCHLCLRKTVSVRDAELEEAVCTPSADLRVKSFYYKGAKHLVKYDIWHTAWGQRDGQLWETWENVNMMEYWSFNQEGNTL